MAAQIRKGDKVIVLTAATRVAPAGDRGAPGTNDRAPGAGQGPSIWSSATRSRRAAEGGIISKEATGASSILRSPIQEDGTQGERIGFKFRRTTADQQTEGEGRQRSGVADREDDKKTEAQEAGENRQAPRPPRTTRRGPAGVRKPRSPKRATRPGQGEARRKKGDEGERRRRRVTRA